jgi:hypothetical protein
MRPSPSIITALITAATATAAAAPDGDDSPTLADRTSWLPASTTEVTTIVERVPYQSIALYVDTRHSFGMIEPFVGASFHFESATWPLPLDALRGGVWIPITCWAALRMMGRRQSSQYDAITWLDAAAEVRVPLRSHQAALRAMMGGGFRHGAVEGFFLPLFDSTTNDPYGFASMAAILQSTSTVALELGARVDVGTIEHLPSYKQLSPYGTLLFAVDHVDLFARVSFEDVTAHVETAIALGAAARF